MNIPHLTTRRDFLRTGILGGALSWSVPGFLLNTMQSLHAAAAESAIQTATGISDPILVVLQLAGGNDGLNTVVPIGNDFYHQARPQIGIAEKNVLRLNDTVGLNPALKGFKDLYDNGHLAVIQGVGYPNPNRSHFRSMEIWQTGSDANRFEKYGWLGRYFDNQCPDADASTAINLGTQTPQAFSAAHPCGLSFDNPQRFKFTNFQHTDEGGMLEGSEDSSSSEFSVTPNSGGSIDMIAGPAMTDAERDPLAFLARTQLDVRVSSQKVIDLSNKKNLNQVAYPGNRLGNQLSLISKLIGGGMKTRVYYLSHGGFDTHTNQVGSHERLLTELGDGLKAFMADMEAQGNAGRVAVMTFSEFGRRVKQNASNGTDHGAAAPLFVLRKGIQSGLIGKMPSLAPQDLTDGDLRYNVDFRSVYATLLEKHLKAPSEGILGKAFPIQSFV